MSRRKTLPNSASCRKHEPPCKEFSQALLPERRPIFKSCTSSSHSLPRLSLGTYLTTAGAYESPEPRCSRNWKHSGQGLLRGSTLARPCFSKSFVGAHPLADLDDQALQVTPEHLQQTHALLQLAPGQQRKQHRVRTVPTIHFCSAIRGRHLERQHQPGRRFTDLQQLAQTL